MATRSVTTAATAAPAAGLGGYQSAYNSALQQNQQLYQNVLGGYRDVLAQQRRETDPIISGYGDLQKAVQGQYGSLQQSAAGLYTPLANAAYTTLGGGALQNAYAQLYGGVMNQINSVGGAAQQQITDQYARERGSAAQQLTAAGLGNTTVRSAVDRGLTYDQSKAQVNLADQLAGTRASYMLQAQLPALSFWERNMNAQADQLNRMAEYRSGQAASLGGAAIGQNASLGLAGLGYQGNVQNERNALEQSYLNYAGSPQIQYPDATPYMQSAQMLYQAQQDQLAQQQAQKAAQQAIALGLRQPAGGGGAAGLGTGYMPSAGPSAMPGGEIPLGGAGGGMLGYDNANTAAGFYSTALAGAAKPFYGQSQALYPPYAGAKAAPGYGDEEAAYKGSGGYYDAGGALLGGVYGY